MKKFFCIAVFILIFFAACGGGRGGKENETENLAEESAATEETAPTEAPVPTIAPTPALSPIPENETRIIFESGIMGVKLSFDNLPMWNFENTHRNWASFNVPFLEHSTVIDRADYEEAVLFSFAEIATDPSEVRWGWFEVSGQQWPSPQPQSGEPDEIFVTENGLTVVQYLNEVMDAPWFFMNAEDYTEILFVFRRDGRDYREIEGRQIYYGARLLARSDMIEHYYENARAVINSLQFHDDAAISLPLSETAASIGITPQNFPRISDSGFTYRLIWRIIIAMIAPSQNVLRYQTHFTSNATLSYELLIAGEVDLILVPEPPPHILNLAEESGVALEFFPIAVDALIFLTSAENSVSGITIEQLQKIYINRSITNWAQLGGEDVPVRPLISYPHRELMNTFVLEGREIHPDNFYAICATTGIRIYDVSFYHENMAGIIYESGRTRMWSEDESVRSFALGYYTRFSLGDFGGPDGYADAPIQTLALNGVMPSLETIQSGEYPFSQIYYAVIRTDTPQGSPARNMTEWLLTPEGQNVVEAAGLGRID
jgi:phosphate transport system substrate-binding protein